MQAASIPEAVRVPVTRQRSRLSRSHSIDHLLSCVSSRDPMIPARSLIGCFLLDHALLQHDALFSYSGLDFTKQPFRRRLTQLCSFISVKPTFTDYPMDLRTKIQRRLLSSMRKTFMLFESTRSLIADLDPKRFTTKHGPSYLFEYSEATWKCYR